MTEQKRDREREEMKTSTRARDNNSGGADFKARERIGDLKKQGADSDSGHGNDFSQWDDSRMLVPSSLELGPGAVDKYVISKQIVKMQEPRRLTRDDMDEARRQFEVNLFGLARLTQLVVPAMRKQGSGRIVNVSSMGGKVYTPLGAWYHASEHALEGWSDCLRIELAPFGIDVALIEPGAVETEFCNVVLDPMLERSESGPYAETARRMERATRNTYASGRASSPVHIARVIAKALEAKRPRTRYVCGHLAHPVMVARRLLSDRMFDRIIRWFG